MRLTILSIALLSVLNINNLLAKEVLSIDFYDKDRPPLVIVNQNGTYSGFYHKALNKILGEAKIDFELTPTALIRKRQNFWKGRTVLSCCVAKNWRKSKEEMAVQLFSEPFTTLEDVFVYKKGETIDFKDINNTSLALIRGFSYRGDKNFKKIQYLTNEEAILGFLNEGRAKLTIVNKSIAKYLIKKYGYALEIGPVFSQDEIRIRVHKSRSELLPKINKAIKKLKTESFLIN